VRQKLMGRLCTICSHAERKAINGALVGIEPLRTIESRWSVSKTALLRHKKSHLPATLVKAEAAAAAAEGDSLLVRYEQASRATSAILEEARTAGRKDNSLALKAIARVEKQFEIGRRLISQAGASASVTASPEWQKLRAAILVALEPFPDARLAVAKAVKEPARGAGKNVGA
jgi:hypothetical protein